MLGQAPPACSPPEPPRPLVPQLWPDSATGCTWSYSQLGDEDIQPQQRAPAACAVSSHLCAADRSIQGGSECCCCVCHRAASLAATFLVRDGLGRAIWGSTECEMSETQVGRKVWFDFVLRDIKH